MKTIFNNDIEKITGIMFKSREDTTCYFSIQPKESYTPRFETHALYIISGIDAKQSNAIQKLTPHYSQETKTSFESKLQIILNKQ